MYYENMIQLCRVSEQWPDLPAWCAVKSIYVKRSPEQNMVSIRVALMSSDPFILCQNTV